MHWFEGGIAEAIGASKIKKAVFVVFVAGSDDASKSTTSAIDSAEVSSKLESDDFVAIRLESGSESYRQFVQISSDQLVPVPSLFFIGKNGEPVEILAGERSSSELSASIDKVLEKCGKKSTSSMDVDNAVAQGVSQSNLESVIKQEVAGNLVKENPPLEKVVDQVKPSEELPSGSLEAAVAENREPSPVKEEQKEEVLKNEEAVAQGDNQSESDKAEHVKQLIVQNRLAREAEEKAKEVEREEQRRRAGKEAARFRREQEEKNMRMAQKEREKQKAEEKATRDRILQQIAMDSDLKLSSDKSTSSMDVDNAVAQGVSQSNLESVIKQEVAGNLVKENPPLEKVVDQVKPSEELPSGSLEAAVAENREPSPVKEEQKEEVLKNGQSKGVIVDEFYLTPNLIPGSIQNQPNCTALLFSIPVRHWAEQSARFEAEKNAAKKRKLEEDQRKAAEEQERAAALAAARSNIARIQFRLPDGTSHTHQFNAGSTLADVRAYVKANLNLPFRHFSISLAFPRREFTAEDDLRTLRDLELSPSAAVLILPVTSSEVASSGPGGGGFSAFIWSIVSRFMVLFTILRGWVFGSGETQDGQGSSGGRREDVDRKNQSGSSSISSPPPSMHGAIRRRGSGMSLTGSSTSSGTLGGGTSGGESSRMRREGNVHRLPSGRDGDSDDDNNTWNGNSTQQM
ncbi:hypothetical protein J437_LFUL000946 [Ladona fulva]|uniref:UBX domain-containing protein 4 n=1 Tax=Ladona fulva TaxID=123851 RepID=A0A8K0K918_LADFU|nr:hypothetical protein J437_LFUL000946 [Ladona fulva]